MKKMLLLMLSLGLFGCSTTSSDVRQVMKKIDRSYLGEITLAVGGAQVQTSAQDSSRIFTLRHSAEQVQEVARNVARLYGFQLAELAEAEFYLELTKAAPDGGACFGRFKSITEGGTFTASVVTLGITPVSGGHCMVVNAALYRMLGGERLKIGDFESNAGRIDVYAGANEVDNYQLTVDLYDETRALEASIGGLINVLVTEGALLNSAYYGKPLPP